MVFEPLPLFSINNPDASSKDCWSSLICISTTSPGKSYSVLKSARVKHLLKLYWLNVHFLTTNNIKFLHTPEKKKMFYVNGINLSGERLLWIQPFGNFGAKPWEWFNSILKRGQTFAVQSFWKIGKQKISILGLEITL